MSRSQTFTLLVTVTATSDTQAATITTATMSAAIQQALEDGTRSFNHVKSALVHAFAGDQLREAALDPEWTSRRTKQAQHRSAREA